MKAEDILQRIKAAGLEIVGTPEVADGDDSERWLILDGIEGTEAQWQALLSPPAPGAGGVVD